MDSQQRKALRLVLHFDVNKTIIISDSASGKSMDVVLNEIIAGCVWGEVNHERLVSAEELFAGNYKAIAEYKLQHGWTCVSVEPSVSPPDGNEEFVNFHAFVECVYPYVKIFVRDDDTKADVLKAQLESNHMIRSMRREILDTFTDVGNYGHQFRKYYELLLEKLRIPSQGNRSPRFVNLIPSLFNLIVSLEIRKQKEGIDYTIVFRTFGDPHDVEKVCSEFNRFCNGTHEYFSVEKDLQEALKFRKINLTESPDNYTIGYFYVNGNDSNGSHLVSGSLSRPKEMDKVVDPSIPVELLLKHQQSGKESVHLISGVKQIYNTLLKEIDHGRSLFYRDYWYWWNSHREESQCGKRFIFDPSDRSTLQIFFDDNSVMEGWPNRGIISLIDANTGEILDQQKYLKVTFWNSEPYNAIMDEHYFEKCVLESESNWNML